MEILIRTDTVMSKMSTCYRCFRARATLTSPTSRLTNRRVNYSFRHGATLKIKWVAIWVRKTNNAMIGRPLKHVCLLVLFKRKIKTHVILNYALSCSVTAPKMTQTFLLPIEFRNVFNIQQNNKLSRFWTYYPKYIITNLRPGIHSLGLQPTVGNESKLHIVN